MTKISRQQVQQTLIDEDIWEDEWSDIDNEYWIDYWEGVHRGELSWQWYMTLVNYKDWHPVVINPIHKHITVKVWLDKTYPGCEYQNEGNHFIFKDPKIATWVALKWT